MRASHFVAVLSTALLAWGSPEHIHRDTFHESLTLHPLPDGKLSVLFEFTTYFSLHGNGSQHQSHHVLTPPALLLPLEKSHVSELTVSFVSGQWLAGRYGESGPLTYSAGGAGAEVRAWLLDQGDEQLNDGAWDDITHALGGMFCAGLGADNVGESVRSFGPLYPPVRERENLTHYLVPHPHLQLCTENLTPFLSLLPSKGVSGLSALLAQPGIVLGWGFKTEGIEVVMPQDEEQGTWTGWWEGVVDLVPERGGSRSFSITSLFQKPFPRVFPAVASSLLRVITPRDPGFLFDPAPADVRRQWIDGEWREVAEWDLRTDKTLVGRDLHFWWDGEGIFTYPLEITPPPVTVSRVVGNSYGSDGTFIVELANHADVDRPAVYSEVWPWWVRGWLSEITVGIKGDDGKGNDLIKSIEYHPSTPPKLSTTSLHLSLTLPAKSTVVLSIPFTKLTLKYTEHVPDAERGREIPASVLTLLDVEGEGQGVEGGEESAATGTDVRRSSRARVYGPKILLDVPTPDFSMPYNVIIMSSTVMAIFFGSIQGRLVRRWGWVENEVATAGTANGNKDGAEDRSLGERAKVE